MTYKKDLGRVRGEKGVTYTPKITIEKDANNIDKQYISWESSDGSDIPPSLAKKEFASKVYKPSIDSNGNISFQLIDANELNLNLGNIKGPQGIPGHIEVEVVTALPARGEEGTIYVYGENAYVWGEKHNGQTVETGWYQIENALDFSNYYTKQETYNKNEVYDKNSIDNFIGTVKDQQNAIAAIIDNGPINILSDEDDESYLDIVSVFSNLIGDNFYTKTELAEYLEQIYINKVDIAHLYNTRLLETNSDFIQLRDFESDEE